MAGPTTFVNDVAYKIGREGMGRIELGEMEGEGGDGEIRGEIRVRVRVRVIAVVSFDCGEELI